MRKIFHHRAQQVGAITFRTFTSGNPYSRFYFDSYRFTQKLEQQGGFSRQESESIIRCLSVSLQETAKQLGQDLSALSDQDKVSFALNFGSK